MLIVFNQPFFRQRQPVIGVTPVCCSHLLRAIIPEAPSPVPFEIAFILLPLQMKASSPNKANSSKGKRCVVGSLWISPITSFGAERPTIIIASAAIVPMRL